MGLITDSNQTYYEGSEFGGYQYVSLDSIINNFILMFTGEQKVIPKANRTEIMMHAKRGIQEFSYDVFKSYKSQEIEVPPSLTIKLPQDYVNYTEISWIDTAGIERPVLPLRFSSNPSAIVQDSNYDYEYDVDGALSLKDYSEAWERLKDREQDFLVDNYLGDMTIGDYELACNRYGLDPEFANANGSFYIDQITGLIHLTSSLRSKILHLKYISDGLGNDSDLVVHKFAEDAIYKYILYAIVSVTVNAQEYLVRRYKRSFVAAKRVAKLRLSNYKLHEVTQLMRGKSKQIKH